jgi:nucleoid-associated protein YgaU
MRLSVHERRNCDLSLEGRVGLFDKKEKPKADFSNVRSGSSTNAPDVRSQPEVRQEPADARYTVRKGDTLSAIARREYGDAGAWQRIFEANRDQLDNPDLIHPGQELRIPKAEGGAR